MRLGSSLGKLWYKFIYAVVVTVYLIYLGRFNKELLAQEFDTPFDLLVYKDEAAIKFFIIALVLFLVGCIMIYMEIKKLKGGLGSFEEIVIAGLTIIIVVMLLLLIIIFIDNPILRAILFVVLAVVGGISTIAS